MAQQARASVWPLRKAAGSIWIFFPPTHPGRCPSAGSSMELRRFALKQRQTFITRVNELQGQATTLEVSTVVVLHSRIDEARQAAWPGRRGCTPRPSQPPQLRRRLTTRLVGSRIALRITEIPPGILNPVTDKTRTGQAGRGQDGAGFLDRNPSTDVLGAPKSPAFCY